MTKPENELVIQLRKLLLSKIKHTYLALTIGDNEPIKICPVHCASSNIYKDKEFRKCITIDFLEHKYPMTEVDPRTICLPMESISIQTFVETYQIKAKMFDGSKVIIELNF